jgi:hypothetical protein
MYPRCGHIGHERFDLIAEGKLEVVTGVAQLLRIVSFGGPFLVTFHVDHTAVDVDRDSFVLDPYQELSKQPEIDLSQHLGGLVTEVAQKPGDRFPLFYRNGILMDQRVTLQQLQTFQLVDPNEVATQHGPYVVHLDLVRGFVPKNQFPIDPFKDLIFPGIFEQEKQSCIRGELSGGEFDGMIPAGFLQRGCNPTSQNMTLPANNCYSFYE